MIFVQSDRTVNEFLENAIVKPYTSYGRVISRFENDLCRFYMI